MIEAGKLSLDSEIWDLLPFNLGQINKKVTIFHLLTHTSGIGDYIDEESDELEQMRELYDQYPVYLWERLEYYLQMITPLPQKFGPGLRFGYSNAGFVLLGLAIEAAGGKAYQRYVTDEIIVPLELRHTGFYRTDALPASTAHGYIRDATGGWRTNVFNLPVIGGSDGGLYTTARDLDILWRALFDGRVLSGKMLRAFLAPQAQRGADRSYGLGVYRYGGEADAAYYAVGGDFGVDFFTAYFPDEGITASALGNTEINTFPLLAALFGEDKKA